MRRPGFVKDANHSRTTLVNVSELGTAGPKVALHRKDLNVKMMECERMGCT